MTFKKKGQAALEFLTTYGWAFLIILVMIGALAYFGVLDPSNFAAERCVAKTPLTCDGQNYIATNESIRVSLRNGLNEDINLTNIRYRTGSSEFVQCNTSVSAPANQTSFRVNGSRTGELACGINASAPVTIGQRERIEIRYTECSGSDITNCEFGRAGDIQLYTNIQEQP